MPLLENQKPEFITGNLLVPDSFREPLPDYEVLECTSTLISKKMNL
jgi:hypothetical protein